MKKEKPVSHAAGQRDAAGKFLPNHSVGLNTRWKDESGNPAGLPAARRAFENAFYSALLGEGSAEEAAKLLWAAARKGEPWAIQTLLQRLAPQNQSLKLVHERGTDDEFDFRKLTDEQIRQLEAILDNGQSLAIESGEGPTQPV